jgi:hypothetical protein
MGARGTVIGIGQSAAISPVEEEEFDKDIFKLMVYPIAGLSDYRSLPFELDAGLRFAAIWGDGESVEANMSYLLTFLHGFVASVPKLAGVVHGVVETCV